MQHPPAPRLTGWDVKRSGPALTVTGDENGTPRVVTSVRRVKRLHSDDGPGPVVALDGNAVVLAYLT